MAYAILKMMTYNTCVSMRFVNDEEKRQKQYDDIDTEKTHLNRNLTEHNNYVQMYKDIIKKSPYYTTKDKYGRTHKEPKVKALGFIATFSPEAKENIDLEEWVATNKKYFEDKFKGCPISISLHLDQTTPHLHVFVIPVTEKGKISKTQFINGKKDMVQLQDEYAKAMKPFELERGIHKEQKDKNHTEKKQIQKYRKIKNTSIKLKKDIETLTQEQNALTGQNKDLLEHYNYLVGKYKKLANSYNELVEQYGTINKEIEKLNIIKKQIEYDIAHLSDSVLDDNYINPYKINDHEL